jgi:gamma-glutamyltranspeptidase / glutathione hydrolase
MKAVVSALLAASITQGFGGDRIAGRMHATRSEVIARHGMAATSQPLATQAAVDILRRGGSAVDAAIAANAVQAVVEPTGCGLGGDLFAIVWSAGDRRLYGLNGSGRSPRGLTAEEFRRRELSEIPARGPLPVSVPGAVHAWFELHRRFGRLPMSEILKAAIEYATEGFPVSPVIAHYWRGAEAIAEFDPNFAATFLPDGRPPAAGEIFRNPDLAETLRKIAQQGRQVFYEGEIARTIDEYCRRMGCFLRMEDFAAHESTWVEPVSTNYRGYDVWELPPNGQGIAVLQMLNLLEAFDLRALGHNSAAYLHHLIEAKKIAFEDRARLYADPDFNAIPVAELISKSYAAERRRLLDPERASTEIPPGDPRLRQGDTIYLATADRDRNMVSLIQSNYMGFGSGLVPDGTGFGLQNRGTGFTLEEGHFNAYAPGKRPFHTIIPAFVTRDGQPYMSFGVMGGDMQPQGHLQVLLNIIDFGMTIQEAGDAARFQHVGSSSPTGAEMTDGGFVAIESGIPAETIRALLRLGHDIRSAPGGFGGYQAIHYDADNGVYWGASESRTDGAAAGF